MTSPPADRPDFAGPSFVGCYRHPDRSTGIRCQRCSKPICGECMNPASVGFQCPQCIGRGRSETRQPRTRFGGSLSTRDSPVTKALIGVLIGLYILNVLSRGYVNAFLAQSNFLIAQGQLWRLVTSGFISFGLLSTLLSALVLFFIGKAMEAQLGSWRYLVLYALAGLGASTVMFLVGPPGLVTAGGSVIGLLAANVAIKLRTRDDVRPDLVLLALLVAANFALTVSPGAGVGSLAPGLGQLGGAVFGLVGGLLLVYAPRARRTSLQVLGLTGLAALCLCAVLAKIALS